MARAQTKADNFEGYTLDELRKALKSEKAYDESRIARGTVQHISTYVTNFFVASIETFGGKPDEMNFASCVGGIDSIIRSHNQRVKIRKERIKRLRKLIKAAKYERK